MSQSVFLKIKAGDDDRDELRRFISDGITALKFSHYADSVTFTSGDEYDVTVTIDDCGVELPFEEISTAHPQWKIRVEHSSHFDEFDGWAEWHHGCQTGEGHSEGDRVAPDRAIQMSFRVLPEHIVIPAIRLYDEPRRTDRGTVIGEFTCGLLLPGGSTTMWGALLGLRFSAGEDRLGLDGLVVEIGGARVPVNFWTQFERALWHRATALLSPEDRARLDGWTRRTTGGGKGASPNVGGT